MSPQMHDHQSDNEIPSQMEHPAVKKEKDDLASYVIIKLSKTSKKYRPFIISTWLRWLRRKNEMFKLIDPESYYVNYSKYINHILDRPNVTINVAVLSDDHDVALGWSVYEGEKLHFVFIKPDLRKLGISNDLIPKNIKSFSHITSDWLEIWPVKFSTAKYNPF